MLKYYFIPALLALVFAGCSTPKKQADLILHNAAIYTVDSAFSTCQALAVKDGSIIAIGGNNEVLTGYEAAEVVNAQGKAVFPGFIDAHCHFMGYGIGLGQVNLFGTASFKEVTERVAAFSKKDPGAMDGKAQPVNYYGADAWIIGRGWDQNDWPQKQYPDNRLLDSLFPSRPVVLYRVDGHAALANSEALKRAGITLNTSMPGGEIIRAGNKLTGVLIDNAVDLVKNKIPAHTLRDLSEALLKAQYNCLAYGLTTIDDAGVMQPDIALIDSLQQAGKLKMRIYAMLSDSQPNYNYYLERGPYKTGRLNVCSFKFYADGALGSRGACLFKDYHDKPHWKGFLLSSIGHFEQQAAVLAKRGFQVNTHCIGDSAMHVIMGIYARHCAKNNNRRWRIEHAQVIDPRDIQKFKLGIIPSVQPTHATSDMYWAADRLGAQRVTHAYAYRELLDAAGLIALGTDFPVEDISPFKTFFAAVARQDGKGFPAGGFQKENALSRRQALQGITIWAAYANFEENEKGSLEKGKLADFVIVDTDLMKCPPADILKARVLSTYINGEKVFAAAEK